MYALASLISTEMPPTSNLLTFGAIPDACIVSILGCGVGMRGEEFAVVDGARVFSYE